MFRPMRRGAQSVPPEECLDILRRGVTAVLAVAGDDGYPYAVPLNYLYHEGSVFFHCAKAGHKLDAIRARDKVSLCVIDADAVAPAEYATNFRSVIAFGHARVLDDDAEKRRALELLTEKYAPRDEEGKQREIAKDFARVCMVEIRIEHITGKEGLALARARKKEA
ncbi:MAG: pyridoxamine 5'-phosphate oxidase family protein [Desulfovibrionaceae bacterium]|nr:pyridoxamine 5'-phosphate oxidase family protein [Desulfovibrionaceae bacterium]